MIPNHVLVSLLLYQEGIGFSIITGDEVLKLSKGKVRPSDGLVKPIPFGEVYLRDIYEAVEFINKHGLRRC
jgi:hypothetical protein